MENDKKGACCSPERKTSRYASIRSALAIETSYQVALQDLTTVKLDDNPVRQAHAAQNDRCRGIQSTADRRKSRRDYRQRCGGYSELRGDLCPLLQAADPGTGRKLVGHNDLITRVQPNAVKLCPIERPVHVVGGDYDSVRAQHKSVVHVGLGFSLARYLKIRSG